MAPSAAAATRVAQRAANRRQAGISICASANGTEVAAAGSSHSTTSVDSRPRGFDCLRPFLDLDSQMLCKLLRRTPGYFKAEPDEMALHFGRAQDAVHLGV